MKPIISVMGNEELKDIVTKIDFPSLVEKTHTLTRERKILCPFHHDTNASCHVYSDGFYCYSCNARGDALNWLEQVHNLSKVDAITELKRLAGTPTTHLGKPVAKRTAQPKALVKPCEAKPLSDGMHVQFWQRLEQLKDVPQAAQNRGILDANECRALGIAANGNDAVLAITDPLGNIVAFKQRRHTASENQPRYFYLTKDCGTPAWCSPCFFTAEKVMVIEGELNAMVLSLARQNNDPDIAFMGVAGTNGSLWLEALKGKTVYLYADGDESGQAARGRWAQAATQAGAKAVHKLKPLTNLMDFCDVAAKQGRDVLREGMLKCLF
jgi:hypothetical protein